MRKLASDAYQLPFDQIYRVNAATLGGLQPGRISHIEDLLALDQEARAFALGQIAAAVTQAA